MSSSFNRRRFLQTSFSALGGFVFALNMPVWASTALVTTGHSVAGDSLLPPDENSLMLPKGFTSRIVARSGEPPANSSYEWHAAPDGGATFATHEGGWIYVSNSEIKRKGGAGALKFDAHGNIIDAYPILTKTNRNCAGGATPWNTWLSCEEVEDGAVYECDPFGKAQALRLESMGIFRHEAAAVDPKTYQIYLTEDQPDGLFYRFTPAHVKTGGRPSLSEGLLEAAVVENEKVTWAPVPEPTGGEDNPTRKQIPNATPFSGGEGAACKDGVIYFSTKHDNRIWAYNIARQSMSVFYDAATNKNPILTGVDNITIAPGSDLIVAEDGGNMELVALKPDGTPYPLVRVMDHMESEMTGPAFSPDGTRLYFSSQRGREGKNDKGVTFEVTGPF